MQCSAPTSMTAGASTSQHSRQKGPGLTPVISRTQLANRPTPKTQDTATVWKKATHSSDMPDAAYMSMSWKTYMPPWKTHKERLMKAVLERSAPKAPNVVTIEGAYLGHHGNGQEKHDGAHSEGEHGPPGLQLVGPAVNQAGHERLHVAELAVHAEDLHTPGKARRLQCISSALDGSLIDQALKSGLSHAH